MAGLGRARPRIEGLGAGLVVVGSAPPEAIRGFREATGYAGTLLVDPSLQSFRTAGLFHSTARTYHPLTFPLGFIAFIQGFRQGRRSGEVYQQGGTFVLGAGEKVRFEWRDRFPGNHPSMDEVMAALG